MNIKRDRSDLTEEITLTRDDLAALASGQSIRVTEPKGYRVRLVVEDPPRTLVCAMRAILFRGGNGGRESPPLYGGE